MTREERMPPKPVSLTGLRTQGALPSPRTGAVSFFSNLLGDNARKIVGKRSGVSHPYGAWLKTAASRPAATRTGSRNSPPSCAFHEKDPHVKPNLIDS